MCIRILVLCRLRDATYWPHLLAKQCASDAFSNGNADCCSHCSTYSCTDGHSDCSTDTRAYGCTNTIPHLVADLSANVSPFGIADCITDGYSVYGTYSPPHCCAHLHSYTCAQPASV